MPEIGKGYVSIEPDRDHFDRSLRDMGERAGDNAKDAGKKIGKALAIGIGAAVAGIGIAGVVGKSLIDSASDLNETLSKSNTVFGTSAKAIEDWSKTAASSLGQSQKEALDAASTFGNLFAQLGIGDEVAADMSIGLTELASDFASFHNADITQVIEAQTAAFRGEYDALQRFVPTINGAAVEQKALEMTGKASTKMLTAQDKALAVNTLMMEGAGAAVGDFARTSDGAANQQRIFAAKLADLRAELGQRLLPIFQAVVGWLIAEGLPAFERFGRWLEENVVPHLVTIGEVIRDDVVPALVSFGEWIIKNEPVLIGILAAVGAGFLVWAINAGLAAVATIAATWPIIALVAAIGLLVAAVVYAYTEWEWFRVTVHAIADFIMDTLIPAFQSMWNILLEVFNWIRDHWQLVLILLTGPIGAAIVVISEHFDKIKGFVTAAYNFIAEWAPKMWDALKTGLAAVVQWILEQIDRMLGPLDEALAKANDLLGLSNKSGLTSGGSVLRDYQERQRQSGSGFISEEVPVGDMLGASASSYVQNVYANEFTAADVAAGFSYLELVNGMGG